MTFAQPLRNGTLLASMFFRRNYSPNRRSPRQWWNNSVEVFTGSTRLSAIGVNISNEGMCLFAVADLPVGSQLKVRFQHLCSEEPVTLLATVRHRALYLYGVEFHPQVAAIVPEIESSKEA